MNLRKLHAVYWTIAEFGPAVLSDEEAWLEIAILKAQRVKKLLGGASGLAVAILELFYNNQHDALATSVFLQLACRCVTKILVTIIFW